MALGIEKGVDKMAIKSNIVLDNGLIINNAYLRIESFSGTEKSVSFVLNVYASSNAYDENKPPVTSFSYRMEFDKDKNLFAQMYSYLRNLPEYENAVEA